MPAFLQAIDASISGCAIHPGRAFHPAKREAETPKEAQEERAKAPEVQKKLSGYAKAPEVPAQAEAKALKAQEADLIPKEQAEIIPQAGDDSCLFHSLSYGLSGHSSDQQVSRALRMDIVHFIREHPEHKIGEFTIADWISLDSKNSDEPMSVDAYAQWLSKGSSWGGALEIAVCSILKDVNIHVWQRVQGGGYRRMPGVPSASSTDRTIHICFKGGIHNGKQYGHYDALNVRAEITTGIGATLLNHAMFNDENTMRGGASAGEQENVEMHADAKTEDAMLNEKMKSVFARSDLDGTGLVSEDALCKFFTTCLRMLGRDDVDTGLLMSIVHPYRCSADPTMIEYISLINNLWPPSEDSTNSSVAEMNKLKKRAEELSAKVEAELASIGGSSSDDIEKLAAKADELYVKVVQDVGGAEAIQQHKLKSTQLQSEIKRRLGEKVPWRHDFIIHHLGLVGLIDVGQRVIKPIFDSLVGKSAQKFAAVALIPAVKGPERAGVKVRTRYGGDVAKQANSVKTRNEF